MVRAILNFFRRAFIRPSQVEMLGLRDQVFRDYVKYGKFGPSAQYENISRQISQAEYEEIARRSGW